MVPNNPLRWLFLLVGVGSLYGAFTYVDGAKGDELGQALTIMVPFAAIMIAFAIPPPSEPGSTAGVTAAEVSGPGYPVRGTIFHMASARRSPALVGLGGFMTIGIGMALFPGEDTPESDPASIIGIGITIALVFGVLLALTVRSMARGGGNVVLTEQGITQRGRLKVVHVDWDELAGVARFMWRGADSLVLHRDGRADVYVPLQLLAADPNVLEALVRHLHATPRDRVLLADPGGEAALARLGLVGEAARPGPA